MTPFRIIAFLPDPANPKPGDCTNDTGCGLNPCVCRPCGNCNGTGPLDNDDLCDKCRPEPVEDLVCARCNGSGEGSYDGSRCTECRGSGSAMGRERAENARRTRAESRREMRDDDQN